MVKTRPDRLLHGAIAGIVVICVSCIAATLLRSQEDSDFNERRKSVFRDAYNMLIEYGGANSNEPELIDLTDNGSVGGQRCSWRFVYLTNAISVSKPVRPNEPWDSTYNSSFLPIDYFCYPNSDQTFILAVTGQGTAFPRDQAERFKKLDNDTILAIEVIKSKIHWMEPKDFEIIADDNDEWHFSHAPGNSLSSGFYVLFADGEQWLLENGTPNELLRKFMLVKESKIADRKLEFSNYRIE